MISSKLRGIFPSLMLAAVPAHAQLAPPDSFRLHKFAQPIGWEIDTRTTTPDSTRTDIRFSFVDRGSPVPMTGFLTTDPRNAVTHLKLRGFVARGAGINAEVDFTPGKSWSANLRNDTTHTTASGTTPAFVITGYSPVANQEALIRWWKRSGRPDSITTLPGGFAKVHLRGRDTVSVAGKRVILERYALDGIVWGQESLWMHGDTLVALVTRDAEFDHFEALRPAYVPSLGRFIERGAADGLARLRQLALAGAPSSPKAYALVGATLIDATGAAPIPDAVVIVKNGRITAAGPRASVKIPHGIPQVNVAGKTIVPGLWDMHAHYEQVEWGPIYLASGVTTVRDVGNVTEFMTSVRDAIAAGRGIGPHILLAGLVDGTGPFALGVTRVDSASQVQRAVSNYKRLGYQQIKIYSSVTPAMVAEVARVAHANGMTVTGHVPRGMNVLQAIDSGMDQVNHAPYLRGPAFATGNTTLDTSFTGYKALRDKLLAHHTVLDPTLVIYEWEYHAQGVPMSSFEPGVTKLPASLRTTYEKSGVSSADSAKSAATFSQLLQVVGALHRDGVPIMAGTDQVVPGHSLHREMELYVRAGFTPMEAIQSATSVPAHVMGLDAEVGTVTVGKRADLLVVDGDPLADIANLRRVALVISGGVQYKPAPLWRLVDFKP
ncbi:MAG: amidohydrolase [Gemmatimonadetes bacterium]|nr:amidohydrolase [Gemmatimonadota bacterium]